MIIARLAVGLVLPAALLTSCSGGSTGGEHCFNEVPAKHRPVEVECAPGGSCERDSDCILSDGGVRLCSCAPSGVPNGPGHTYSYCLQSECRVDADCACGYCSPSEDPYCTYRSGYDGYFCHTQADACINDSDCDAGFCSFNSMVGHWACAIGYCNG